MTSTLLEKGIQGSSSSNSTMNSNTASRLICYSACICFKRRYCNSACNFKIFRDSDSACICFKSRLVFLSLFSCVVIPIFVVIVIMAIMVSPFLVW